MNQKGRILIIDDNRALVLAAERVLQKAGYDVITAGSGAEGLLKAGNEKPDLIILDIVMPEMDGYTVCRNLKKSPGTACIPVIILSNRGEVDNSKAAPAEGLGEVYDAYECGAHNFLTKPVAARDLLEAVRNELSFSSMLGL